MSDTTFWVAVPFEIIVALTEEFPAAGEVLERTAIIPAAAGADVPSKQAVRDSYNAIRERRRAAAPKEVGSE